MEQEVLGKTVDISPDGLIQHLGRNPVQRRQVAIQHDLLTANLADQRFDLIDQNQLRFVGHCVLSHGRPGFKVTNCDHKPAVAIHSPSFQTFEVAICDLNRTVSIRDQPRRSFEITDCDLKQARFKGRKLRP